MKIGVCCGNNVENMKIAKRTGFDFIETNCGDIVKADDSLIEEMKNIGLPIFSANCFIGQRVVGPEKDDEKISEYLNKLFERASYLGLKIIVFGSSGARKRREEENLTTEDCKDQIVDFINNHVVPLAEKYQIRIAIEPLRPQECNVISRIADGVEIAKRVNSPYIKVLADVRHMIAQDEPMSEIDKYSEWLIHAHTSNPYGDDKHDRVFPKADDKFNQDDFVLPAIKAGIEQVAVEAAVNDFEKDASEAYEVLKKYR